MRFWKKHLPTWTMKTVSLLLVLTMAILPAVAEVLSKLPEITPPTYSGPAYETVYSVSNKVDRIELANGNYKDLPYTEYAYTINVHGDYLNAQLGDTTLTRERLKEILRENLPQTVYDMIASRDPAIIREMLSDLIKEELLRFFRETLAEEKSEEAAPASERVRTVARADGLKNSDITPELLDQIKRIADGLIGDGKAFTKEEAILILDLNMLIEDFEIPAEDLPLVTETAPDGTTVVTLNQIEFLDELIAGVHDEAILNNPRDLTINKVTQDVLNGTVLESTDADYSEVLRVLASEFKPEVIDLLARVVAITMGPDRVDVYSEAEGDVSGRFNISAIEQMLLSSIPTMDELIDILGSGETEDVLFEVNFFVHLKEQDSETKVNYYNYVLRIKIDGDQEGRADLAEYIKDAEEYVSYNYELPSEEDRLNSHLPGASDGTLTLNITLPDGLLNVALKVINEENLPEGIRNDLGAAANLNFDDEANHPAIIDAIIQNCSVIDLVTILESIRGTDISAETLAKYHLTQDRVDAVIDRLTRAMNDLERNVNFGNFETDALADYYTGNSNFRYAETLYVDVVEAAEEILGRELPDGVKNRLTGTEIRHDVKLNVQLEDIYQVTYTRGGVETVTFMETGSLLDTVNVPHGWVEDGDATMTSIFRLPAHDVSLAAKRMLTYRYRYSTAEEFSVLYAFFTEKTISAVAKPEAKPGYVFDWDYSGIDGSQDVVLELSSARALSYNKLVTWKIDGVEQPVTEVTFYTDQPILDALNEQLGRPDDRIGYTGAWWIYEETASVSRMARTTTGQWRLLSAEDMPTLDTTPLDVEYRYTAIEYELVYINGAHQEGLMYTVEKTVLSVVSAFTAALKAENPGYDVEWYYGDSEGGAAVGSADKPVAEEELRLFYKLVEAEVDTDTEPEDTEPEDTEPEDTEPEDTEPEDTEPEDTEPEDTEPEDTEPEDTEPEDTEPEDTEPEDTEPEDTEPQPDESYKTPTEAGVINLSFDTFYVNGEMYFPDGNAGEQLDAIDNTITLWADEPHDSIGLRGWIGFQLAIDQFGYYIDETDNVTWSNDFKLAAEDAVLAVGGPNASRFMIEADLSDLDAGTHRVGFVARLSDGTLVRLRTEITVVISDETQPGETQPGETETQPSETGPGDTTPPDSDTETGPGESDTVIVPGVTDTESQPGGTVGKTGFPWWILLILLILLLGIGVLIYLIFARRKDEEEPEPEPEPTPPEEPPAPPAAEPEDTTPLFIPLGEEVPEEEISDEIEIMEEISAETVDAYMTDKAAEHFLVISSEAGGVGKMGIINVGQISEVYHAGDTIDLADLQSRGLVNDSIGRLKVLAAGKLDKSLTIKADAFSVQAIKMITLTGGQAVKLDGDARSAAGKGK